MAPTSPGQAGGDTGHRVDRASCRTEQARTRRRVSPGRRGALLLSSAARHDGRQRPPGRPHSSPRGRPRAPSGTESCSKMRGGHGITRIPWRRDSHGSRFCGERKLWTLASPPSPGGLKITHTQRMFAAEQSRRREAGGSRGKPRLARASRGCTPRHWQGSQLQAGRQLNPIPHGPKQSQPAFVLPVAERKEVFISPDTMTAAPHLLEGAPFCSAYTGQSPVSLARKRGDFASLPHDKPSTARHSSAQSLCPWEPAPQAPTPNHSQTKAPYGWKAGPRHSGPGPRAQGAG